MSRRMAPRLASLYALIVVIGSLTPAEGQTAPAKSRHDSKTHTSDDGHRGSLTRHANATQPTVTYRERRDRIGRGLRLLPLPPWHRRVEILADRRTLAKAFRRAGYTPPRGGLVMAARLRKGLRQPGFEYYSLGETGFRYSYPSRFFVASAIKLAAAVGTLWSLHRRGLTSAAKVELHDADGPYQGTVRHLVYEALIHSSNLGYDRLVALAGFDALNDGFLVARHGLPRSVIQVRFGGRHPATSLRRNPAFFYREGKLRGHVAERVGKGHHPQCAALETCVSLYELQEVLRRVMVDRQLPPKERFALATADLAAIRRWLLKARNRLQPEVSRALGGPVRIYNNVGRQPGRDLVENAFIETLDRKERYLLAVLVPFEQRHDPKHGIRKRLGELARQTLRVLRRRPRGRVLQHGARAGSGLAVDLARHGKTLAIGLRVGADAKHVSVSLSAQPVPCARQSTRHFVCEPQPLPSKPTLLLLEARNGKQVLAYRLLHLTRS